MSKASHGKSPASRVRVAPCPLDRLAVRALLGELETYPKPGLVSRVDNGSHDDMDAASFVRSAFALRSYFRRIAERGSAGAAFAELRDLGIEAERHMLHATGGVNTHRGAIFVLGLLDAAAAARGSLDIGLDAVISDRWGSALLAHRRDSGLDRRSHGVAATERYGVRGAVEEAAAGLPTLFEVVLPAYRAALVAGASSNRARVQAFFASMSTLSDTNLVHRGGRAALEDARREAQAFLDDGGVFAVDWHRRAVELHAVFRARRLSPGGSADMLAACLFVYGVEGR